MTTLALLALTPLMPMQSNPAGPVPAPRDAGAIVVMGAKLSRFRASMVFDGDKARCQVHASSGDADIDQIGCHAIEVCYPQFDAQEVAAAARTLSHRARRTLHDAAVTALDDCFASTTSAGLEQLADRRAMAAGS